MDGTIWCGWLPRHTLTHFCPLASADLLNYYYFYSFPTLKNHSWTFNHHHFLLFLRFFSLLVIFDCSPHKLWLERNSKLKSSFYFLFAVVWKQNDFDENETWWCTGWKIKWKRKFRVMKKMSVKLYLRLIKLPIILIWLCRQIMKSLRKSENK